MEADTGINMLCSHPLTRIETYDGKVSFTGAYIKDAEATKEFTQKLENSKNIKSVKLIPCGQCTSCRLNKSREWANRLMLEAKDFEHNYFITLTYNEEHVPIKRYYNEETGQIITGMTLVKEDLQKFWHDLRQYWERNYNHTGVRYYACGEYGPTNNRPHYHAIVFNLPYLVDMVFYKQTEVGENLYTSETISKIWGKGYVVIGEVTWESAAYVARYVMKKMYGKEADAYYRSQAKIPEFSTMSRMPGIARNYYDMHKDIIYETDEIFVRTTANGIIGSRPGKYFDRLYEQEEPEKFKKIKRKRNNDNLRNTKNELNNVKTVNNIQKQRKIKEEVLQEKIKALKREI